MTYDICHITKVDNELAQVIADLIRTIDDPAMDVPSFVLYIMAKAPSQGLFGAFKLLDGDLSLKGFLYCESPTMIYPGRASLFLTCVDPSVPIKVSKRLYKVTCDWARSQGATYMWGWTKRSPRAIKRLYGFKIAAERQVFSPLYDDETPFIEEDDYDRNETYPREHVLPPSSCKSEPYPV